MNEDGNNKYGVHGWLGMSKESFFIARTVPCKAYPQKQRQSFMQGNISSHYGRNRRSRIGVVKIASAPLFLRRFIIIF